MYTITVKLHGDLEVIATRPSVEAADRYEKLCRTNGVSLGGRWFNPSNITEVTINEQLDTAPVVEADAGPASKPTEGSKARPPVRRRRKQ